MALPPKAAGAITKPGRKIAVDLDDLKRVELFEKRTRQGALARSDFHDEIFFSRVYFIQKTFDYTTLVQEVLPEPLTRLMQARSQA